MSLYSNSKACIIFSIIIIIFYQFTFQFRTLDFCYEPKYKYFEEYRTKMLNSTYFFTIFIYFVINIDYFFEVLYFNIVFKSCPQIKILTLSSMID